MLLIEAANARHVLYVLALHCLHLQGGAVKEMRNREEKAVSVTSGLRRDVRRRLLLRSSGISHSI
jgi:hypothetical protein